MTCSKTINEMCILTQQSVFVPCIPSTSALQFLLHVSRANVLDLPKMLSSEIMDLKCSLVRGPSSLVNTSLIRWPQDVYRLIRRL